MKKLFSLLVGLLMFGTGAYAQDIQLNSGWNAVSTPAYLSDLTFSNGGEGISFTTLKDGSWISVPATVDNIKPLDGFMVYNANSSTVTLTLDYKENPTPAESIWQKQLSRGWNLLGITTTDDPFKGIDATMFVDPTLGGRYTVSNGISNPELGEAYFVFVSDGSIYGGVNTTEVATNEVIEEQPEVVEGQNEINSNTFDTSYITASDIFKDKIYITNDVEYNPFVSFKIKYGDNNLNKLNNLELELLSGNGVSDVSNLFIKINEKFIDPDDITINNGKIIIKGIDEPIKNIGLHVKIFSYQKLGIGYLEYKLTKINGENVDIRFPMNLIANEEE